MKSDCYGVVLDPYMTVVMRRHSGTPGKGVIAHNQIKDVMRIKTRSAAMVRDPRGVTDHRDRRCQRGVRYGRSPNRMTKQSINQRTIMVF